MTNLMQLKLAFLREFQNNYPKSHVGGSIGLMLHGIDLKRDLTISDLDIVMDRRYSIVEHFSDYNILESSCTEDFDTRFVCYHNVKNLFTKVEIRVSPDNLFDTVEYKGHEYNVSKLDDIVAWKTKYAKKGNMKHIEDLFVISNLKQTTSYRLSEFTNQFRPFDNSSRITKMTTFPVDDIQF